MLATRAPAASGPEPDGEAGRDAEAIPSPGDAGRDLGAGLLRLAEEIELQAGLFAETAPQSRRQVALTWDIATDDADRLALPLDPIGARPPRALINVRTLVAAAVAVTLVGLFALVQVVADDSTDSPLARTALVETADGVPSDDGPVVAGVTGERDGPVVEGTVEPTEGADGEEGDDQAETEAATDSPADAVVTGSQPDCSKGALIAAIDSTIDGRPVATVDFGCEERHGLARYRVADSPDGPGGEVWVAFEADGSVWRAEHFERLLDCAAIDADIAGFPPSLCDALAG